MKPEDFPQIASQLRPGLIVIAAKIIGNSDEAKDIVQDVLLKLWLLCPQLREPIDTLARVVTRNMACSYRRRRRPAGDISEMEISSDEEDEREEENLERIMRCIDELPAFQQLVFRLRHIDGMSYAAIADLTGSSETALRQTVSRARKSIRDQYLNRPI